MPLGIVQVCNVYKELSVIKLHKTKHLVDNKTYINVLLH